MGHGAGIFAAFKPDADALLKRISKHFDEAALAQIAKLDPVGSYVGDHLVKLRKSRHGIIEEPLEWKPREVLEFSRWMEPEAPGRTNAWEWR